MTPAGFQQPPHPPPVFNATTAGSIIDSTNKLLERNKALLDKIVRDVTPENATFESVMLPILMGENATAGDKYVNMMYQQVSTDKALRDASRDATELMEEFDIDTKMREDVFRLVEAVYNSRDKQSLSAESLQVLERQRRSYVNNGLLLPSGPSRHRFKTIQKRLSQLCIEGQKNHEEEDGCFWLTPSELEGISTDDIDVAELDKGTGENEGKVKVGFKDAHYLPLMQYAIHEETRKAYAIAYANKMNANLALFKEIIVLRDEAARLVGYETHASLKISENMAKSQERVDEFLEDLRRRSVKGGKKEVLELLEYKKKDCQGRGAPFDGYLYLWDTLFYSRLMVEDQLSVDEAAVAQYFPVESTLEGMLKIYENIFGFVFVKLSEEDCARISATGRAEDVKWHKDVHLFAVWDDEDAGGEFSGYLYLDIHPREGKYNQDANFNIHPGFVNENGERRYPSTALVCNVSKATTTKPALLKHPEVVTLFHELGHGIHDLSSRTTYCRTHGIEVAHDFVEAPSQILENWCWTPSVLKDLSRHHETNESIPDDLLANLVKSRHMNAATDMFSSLLYSIFDMTVHSGESHEATKAMDCTRIWNQLRKDIYGIRGPEDIGMGLDWGNRFLTIDHLITGYDAGYYAYLYSEVFAYDMFHSCFKKDPMDREQGRRYRKVVLERGGSMDEMLLLKEFLGREPNAVAFMMELGLDG